MSTTARGITAVACSGHNQLFSLWEGLKLSFMLLCAKKQKHKQHALNPLVSGPLKADQSAPTVTMAEVLLSGPLPYGPMCVFVWSYMCVRVFSTSSCSAIRPPPHINTHTHSIPQQPSLLPRSMLLFRLRGPVLHLNGWAAGRLAALHEKRKCVCVYPQLIPSCKASSSKLDQSFSSQTASWQFLHDRCVTMKTRF